MSASISGGAGGSKPPHDFPSLGLDISTCILSCLDQSTLNAFSYTSSFGTSIVLHYYETNLGLLKSHTALIASKLSSLAHSVLKARLELHSGPLVIRFSKLHEAKASIHAFKEMIIDDLSVLSHDQLLALETTCVSETTSPICRDLIGYAMLQNGIKASFKAGNSGALKAFTEELVSLGRFKKAMQTAEMITDNLNRSRAIASICRGLIAKNLIEEASEIVTLIPQVFLKEVIIKEISNSFIHSGKIDEGFFISTFASTKASQKSCYSSALAQIIALAGLAKAQELISTLVDEALKAELLAHIS
jgi:hypothetical protein